MPPINIAQHQISFKGFKINVCSGTSGNKCYYLNQLFPRGKCDWAYVGCVTISNQCRIICSLRKGPMFGMFLNLVLQQLDCHPISCARFLALLRRMHFMVRLPQLLSRRYWRGCHPLLRPH